MTRLENLIPALLRWTALLALALGCGRTAEPVGPEIPVASTNSVAQARVSDEFPSTPRISIGIQASGPFKPGVAFTVRTDLTANYVAEEGEFSLRILGEEDPSVGREGRVLAKTRRSYPKGDRSSETQTITVARAGYYLILAASAHPGLDKQANGVTITDGNSQQLWVLVDDEGGRVTEGYDTTIVTRSRQPQFGAYGPFTDESGSRQPDSLRSTNSLRGGQTASLGGPTVSGTIWYYDRTPGVMQTRPVAGAGVNVRCWPLDDSTDVAYTSTTADANDFYSYSCPTGYSESEYEVDFFIQSPTYLWVWSQYGNLAGAVGSKHGGGTVNINVLNNTAAHAFQTYRILLPRVQTRFGRSRSTIEVWAHDSDNSYAIHYNIDVDNITLNPSRVFLNGAQDGMFVPAHEYGHAFQWNAVEAPRLDNVGDACSEEHPVGAQSSFYCALTEGFADVFASWLLGDKLDNSYYLSDDEIEHNIWAGSSGGIIQGAVGGFLYDLLDSDSDPDGAPPETFDAYTFPGSWVLDVIKLCSLVTGTPPFALTFNSLNGVDEFIYCAEGSLAAQALQPPYFPQRGWSYSSLSAGVANPPGYSQQAIRQLWLKNLFNQ